MPTQIEHDSKLDVPSSRRVTGDYFRQSRLIDRFYNPKLYKAPPTTAAPMLIEEEASETGISFMQVAPCCAIMLCLSVFSICCLVIIYMAYFNYKKRNQAGPGPELKPVNEASL